MLTDVEWKDTIEWIGRRVEGQDREFCFRLLNIDSDRWTPAMKSLFSSLFSSYPDEAAARHVPRFDGVVVGDPYGDASRLERLSLSKCVPLLRVDRDGLLCVSHEPPPGCVRTEQGWRPGDDLTGLQQWVTAQGVPVTGSARVLLDTPTVFPTAETDCPTPPPGGFVDHDPDRGVITVVVDYDPRVTAALKDVRGAKWRSKHQHWEFPEREADQVTQIGDRWQWVVSAAARTLGERAGFVRQEALRMSKAVDADLHVPELNPAMRLRPFQLAGVAYAVAKRRTFIADEVGLGKCISPDTPVLVNGEQVLAAQAWNRYASPDRFFDGEGEWAEPSVPLVTTSLSGRKATQASVTRLYRQRVNELLLRVTLQDGSRVTVTKRHKLFTENGWSTKFSVGSVVAVPRSGRPDGSGDDPVDGDCRWVRVASIEEVLHEGWVYDFEVPDGHSYVAGGVWCHNTVTALSACSVTNRQRVLVVCQASLLENWEAEVRKWFPSWSTQIVRGRTSHPLPDVRVVIIGYPVLVARWQDCDAWIPDALILDESHKCKTPGSLPKIDVSTGRVVKKKKGTQVTAAAKAIAKPVRDRDGVVLLLSATPIQNKRYVEWWPQLEILGAANLFGDWTSFIKRYCGGRREFGHWVADGATNGEELHRLLRENCFVRRRKADVLDELPPWESQPVWLPFSTDGAKKYRHAEDDIVGFLVERARQIAVEIGEDENTAAWRARIRAEAAEHLVKVNALRRLSGEAKLPAMLEWVDEFLLDPDKKLVVFAHHREIQASLLAAWQQPYQAAAILTPDEQRKIGEPAEVSKARFQNDRGCRVVVCGPGAKEGHTLTAADTVLVTELPWVPTDLVQMIGRTWGRLSDLHGAQLVVPLGGPDGSIDHRMWRLLESKMESVDAATDGIVATDAATEPSLLQDLVTEWSTTD